MKLTKTNAAVALIAATLVAVPALAHDKGQDKGHGNDRRGGAIEMLFERFDTNGDGQVTQEEVDASQAARFAEADADGDGTLSLEEVLAAQEARRLARQSSRAEAMFERLDEDGDGVLSADEASAVMARADTMFDRLDANEDGAITMEEIEGARKGFRGRGWGRGNH